MKRFISLFAVIVSLLLLLCGCNEQSQTILLCGRSGSISEITQDIEFDKWERGTFVESTQPQSVEYTLGELKLCGEYKWSDIPFGESEQRNTYYDNKCKCWFSLTNDGKLVFLFFTDDIDEKEEKKSEEECEKTAIKYLSSISGINISEYRKTVEYDKEGERYLFHFDKMSGEIQTLDSVTVAIDINGRFQQYKSSFLGEINTDMIPRFDIDEIEKSLREKTNRITKMAQSSFDKMNYDSIQYCITKVNSSEYAIIATVDISFTKNSESGSSKVSEKLQYVILL